MLLNRPSIVYLNAKSHYMERNISILCIVPITDSDASIAQEGHGKIDFASFCFADNEGVKEAFAVGGGIVRRFAHALCNIHGGRGTI